MIPLSISDNWEIKNENQFPSYVNFDQVPNSERTHHLEPNRGWGVFNGKTLLSKDAEHIYAEPFHVDIDAHNAEDMTPAYRSQFGWVDWLHIGMRENQYFGTNHPNSYFLRRNLTDDNLSVFYNGDPGQQRNFRMIKADGSEYSFNYASSGNAEKHEHKVGTTSIYKLDIPNTKWNELDKMWSTYWQDGHRKTSALANSTFSTFVKTAPKQTVINYDDMKPIVFKSIHLINPHSWGNRNEFNSVSYNDLILVPQNLKRRGWNKVLFKVYGGTIPPDFNTAIKPETITEAYRQPTWKNGNMTDTTSTKPWTTLNEKSASKDYALGDGKVSTNYSATETLKFRYKYDASDIYKGHPLRGFYEIEDSTYENSKGRTSIGKTSNSHIGDFVPYSFSDVPQRRITFKNINAAWKDVVIEQNFKDKSLPVLSYGDGIIRMAITKTYSPDLDNVFWHDISNDNLRYVRENIKKLTWSELTTGFIN